MYLARIRITLRKSIHDPQGKAVEQAVSTLGIGGVADVRMGKYVELRIKTEDEASARQTVDEVCRKLLANPVMEDYRFEIENVGNA